MDRAKGQTAFFRLRKYLYLESVRIQRFFAQQPVFFRSAAERLRHVGFERSLSVNINWINSSGKPPLCTISRQARHPHNGGVAGETYALVPRMI